MKKSCVELIVNAYQSFVTYINIIQGPVAVFTFDNSSSHAKLADDILNAANMNLNLGGKQPIMHNTIFNG
jgi:hypothetical protein